MKLAEKLRLLRHQEGRAQGLDRALTQSEVARRIKKETGRGITQAYLSQLESGKRRHLTAETREILSAFFRIHPGYLVDDPEKPGKHRSTRAPLSRWLEEGAERFAQTDPALAELLQHLAADKKAHRHFQLLDAIRRQKGGIERFAREQGIVF